MQRRHTPDVQLSVAARYHHCLSGRRDNLQCGFCQLWHYARALTDYAGNGGTDSAGCCSGSNQGPPQGSDQNVNFDLAAAHLLTTPWWSTATGIIYGGSAITARQIPDGTTKTYLLGEKNLQPQCYDGLVGGNCQADDQSMYQGHDWDTIRWAGTGPAMPPSSVPTSPPDWRPLKDQNGDGTGNTATGNLYGLLNFGGPHSDGRRADDRNVRRLRATISFTMDLQTHWKVGLRKA